MPDWLEILLTVLLLLVMLAGLLGLIIPAFPGLTVIWLAALGFGVIHGFSTLGIVLFVLLTLLMIGGNVVDNLLMGAGARKGGAAWASVIVSLVAGIIFTLIFPALMQLATVIALSAATAIFVPGSLPSAFTSALII